MQYCYCVTRDDLDPSQRAVQAVHAGIESARFGLISPDIEHPHLVLMSCVDASGLVELCQRLNLAGVQYRGFYEPDLPDNSGNPSITAVCTAPVHGARRSAVRKIMSKVSASMLRLGSLVSA